MQTSVDALTDLAADFSESLPSQMKPRERPSEELDAILVLHNDTLTVLSWRRNRKKRHILGNAGLFLNDSPDFAPIHLRSHMQIIYSISSLIQRFPDLPLDMAVYLDKHISCIRYSNLYRIVHQFSKSSDFHFIIEPFDVFRQYTDASVTPQLIISCGPDGFVNGYSSK